MDNPKNLPLYQAIFDHYRKRIESGMLVPGDPLPSEAQMAQLYGVSNITARRALNELKRQSGAAAALWQTPPRASLPRNR